MLSFVMVRKVGRGFEVRNIQVHSLAPKKHEVRENQVHGLAPKKHEVREKLDYGHLEEITFFYTKKT